MILKFLYRFENQFCVNHWLIDGHKRAEILWFDRKELADEQLVVLLEPRHAGLIDHYK